MDSSKNYIKQEKETFFGNIWQEVMAMSYGSLNILIVDDQAGVRFLLDAVVQEEGHNSFNATNGLEALDMVSKVNPHLIFMDIRMPVMDGTKALEKMLEMGCKAEIVIMTAFTENEAIEKASKNGEVKCIIKPFDIEEIRKIIRQTASRVYPQATA